MSCVWHIHVSLRECVLKRSAIEKGDTENVLVLVTSKRGKYMKISEDRRQTEDCVAASMISYLCAPINRDSR